MSTLGTSLTLIGRCADGTSVSREAFARNLADGDVDSIGRAHANYSSVLLICGAFEESLEVAEAGVAWARSAGAYEQYGRFIGGNVADAQIELGRWDAAERTIDELLRRGRVRGDSASAPSPSPARSSCDAVGGGRPGRSWTRAACSSSRCGMPSSPGPSTSASSSWR